MATSCLSSLLVVGALLCGSAPAMADSPRPKRPELASLTLRLEDGRSYSLTSSELKDTKGGALFWNDWAVTNILLPNSLFSWKPGFGPDAVLRAWWTPRASGELPAFILLTAKGPVYPLDPTEASAWALPSGWIKRPRIQSILVGYTDGRSGALSATTIQDDKSGVLVWNDFAVANYFLPFYANAKGLPTSPEDALRFWTSPTTPLPWGPGFKALTEDELPGYMIKPRCIPGYPGVE